MLWKMVNEWVNTKRSTHQHLLLNTLADATYVIAPKFISVGEYVFLDWGNENLYLYESYNEPDNEKIATEAQENHVHLFEYVPKNCQKDVKAISIAIAKNLLSCLKREFPHKKFAVILQLQYADSVIIRFHQIRKGCALYIDPNDHKQAYAQGEIILFR